MYYFFEFFILCFTFVLPGLLMPPMNDMNDLLNSPGNMTLYVALTFLQLLLMLFILKREKNIPHEVFGLVKPRPRDILDAMILSVGLFVVYFIIISLVSILPDEIRGVVASGFRWQLENQYMIPLLFLFCMITGYREELLFRSYIITRGSQLSLPVPYIILASVFSFSILHLYEGIVGVLFSFFSGLYLAFIFVKKKNIHIVAICHGTYNFCSLLLIFLAG